MTRSDKFTASSTLYSRLFIGGPCRTVWHQHGNARECSSRDRGEARSQEKGMPWQCHVKKTDCTDTFNYHTQRSQIEEDSDAGTKRKAKTDTGISKKIKKGKGEEVQPLPRPRYPVEDTELAIYIKPTTAPHTLTAAVPLPSKQFTVPQENIGDLLFVWNFFFKFAEPLKVSPFSLDDFENALRHNQAPACSIILETHLALLKIAVRQTAELRAKQERQLKFGPKRAAPRLSAALSTGVRASSTSVDVVGDDDEKTADDDKTDTEKANADDDDEDQDGGNDKINSLPLLPEEKWWLTKVGADNFTEIIPSFLLSTGRVDDFPNIANALEHLIQKKLVVERNSASPFFGRVFVADGSHWLSDEVDYELQYATLPIVDKLAFLRLLITDSVLHSALVRDFIEKCDAQSLELRKEKRELEQQRKELLEELAELEKKDNGLESNVSTSGDMKVSKSSKDAEEATDVDVSGFDSDGDLSIDGNNSSDVEEDDDDEEVDEDSAEWFDKQLYVDVSHMPHTLLILRTLYSPRRALQKRLNAISDEDLSRTSRQEKSKVQQQIKETEEAKRAAEIRREKALSRQKSAANKAKLAEKRVIYEGLLKLLKREAVVDRDLRSLGGGIRGRPLGRDRFWNRYWWFEGYGSGMAGVMEFNASTGYSTRGTNLIPYVE